MGRFWKPMLQLGLALALSIPGGCGDKKPDSPARSSASSEEPGIPNETSKAESDNRGAEKASGRSAVSDIASPTVAMYTVRDRVVKVTKAEMDQYIKEFTAFHNLFYPTAAKAKPQKFWPLFLGGLEAELAGMVVTEKDIDDKIDWAFGKDADDDYIDEILDFNEVSMETFRNYVKMLVGMEKLNDFYSEHPFIRSDTVFDSFQRFGTEYEIEYLAFNHADYLEKLPKDVPTEKRFEEAHSLATKASNQTKKRIMDFVRELSRDKIDELEKTLVADMEAALEIEEARIASEEPDIAPKERKSLLDKIRKEKDRKQRGKTTTMVRATAHVGFDHIVKTENLKSHRLGPFHLKWPQIKAFSAPQPRPVPAGIEASSLGAADYLTTVTTISLTKPGQISGSFRDTNRKISYLVKLVKKTPPTVDSIDPILYRKAKASVTGQETARLSRTINFYHLNKRYKLNSSVDGALPKQQKTAAALTPTENK